MKFLKTHYGRAIDVIPSDTVNIPNPAGKGLTGTATETVSPTPIVLTSGPLVVGVTYQITDYQATDDFTNVGASVNATGAIFAATGDTPTDWTNGSELTDVSSLIGAYLVDSNANFTTNLLGSIVVNDTEGTLANVIGFVNSTTLLLDDAIFEVNQDYSIYNSANNEGCSIYISAQLPNNITVLTVGGDVVTFVNCGDTHASTILPVNVLKVFNTNTELLSLAALW